MASIIIIGIITLVTVGAIWLIVTNQYVSKAVLASSFVSSLGILGTFWGINKGLAGFDATSLETSVPILIEGMKTAFTTSIAGLMGSIAIRVCYGAFNVETERRDEAEFAELVRIFKRIGMNMEKVARNEALSEEVITNVNHSINQLTETLVQSQYQNEKSIEKLGDKLAEELAGKLANNLVEVLTANQNKLSASMHELTTKLDRRFKALETTYQETGAELVLRLKELETAHQTAGAELSITLDKRFKAVGNNLVTTLDKRFTELDTTFDKRFNDLITTQKDASAELASTLDKRFAAFTTVHKDANDELISTLDRQFHHLTIAQKDASAELVSTLDKRFAAFTTVHKDANAELITTLTEAKTELIATLDTKINSLEVVHKRTGAEMITVLDKKFTKMETVYQAVGNELITDLHKTFNKLDSSYKNIGINLISVVDKRFYQLEASYRDVGASTNSKLRRLNQGFDVAICEFQKFHDTMSDNSTKAIIKALEAVIYEFNDKITTQLGENFHEFNESIIELRNWQIDYKEIIEQNVDVLQTATNSISIVSEAHKEISTNSEQLIRASESVDKTLKYVDETQKLVHGHLNQIVKLNEDVRMSITDLDVYYKKNTHIVQEQVNRSLEELGRQLVYISKQFADDYIPLANKLQRVVKMAEDIEMNKGVDLKKH